MHCYRNADRYTEPQTAPALGGSYIGARMVLLGEHDQAHHCYLLIMPQELSIEHHFTLMSCNGETMKVLSLPDYSDGNPYQHRLTEALEKYNVSVRTSKSV